MEMRYRNSPTACSLMFASLNIVNTLGGLKLTETWMLPLAEKSKLDFPVSLFRLGCSSLHNDQYGGLLRQNLV